MRISILPWLLFMLCFQVYSQCQNDQRSLLLQLKNSLVTSAPSVKLSTWDQKVDCCKWLGISCDQSGSGHVTGLELDHESIAGSLVNSSSLFGLKYLERLNLAFNRFNSTEIPRGLQNLTNLSYLNLSNAGFGGQIPVELSKLSSLAVLDLSSIFQGISTLKLENPNLKMLVQNFTSLRELYLDGVEVSSGESGGWAEAQSSFSPGLRNLSMRACGLSGPFEASLSPLTSLSVLRLDNNNLSTNVPQYFADFANLTTLTLSLCNLQGTFPSKIFQIPTLENLDLTGNGLLGGTIPEFPKKGSLRSLVLSNTNFAGTLPDSITNLSSLKEIDVSNCTFSGPIPPVIGNMTELARIKLSSNSFEGNIPQFLESKNLKYMDLSRNLLTGSLSSIHFEGLLNLTHMDLGYNSFDERIPPSLFGLPQLQKLMLSNNNFSGQVEVPTLSSSPLDTIDLSSNQLQGPIPEAFLQIKNLNVLSLSYNKFVGPMELEKFYMLINLTRLELAYNKLSVGVENRLPTTSQSSLLSKLTLASCNLSSFPDVRNHTKITFLDLSNNNIKGEIPSWIWGIGDGGLQYLNLSYNQLENFQKPYNISSSIGVLDLHANRLQGELPIPRETSAIYIDYSSNYFQNPIPQDIGEFITSAIFFSIANNSINGTIPPSLCDATYLQVLDLSVNNLTGDIPTCLLQNSTNIGVLNLGRNNIGGRIPDIFPATCGLKTLDLSRNNLWGSMPASLANCSSLEVLNVGNNRIEDGFPCMLTNSSSLRVLVLRNNRFHGGIICDGFKRNWTNLQIIDIASNKFNGSMSPSCIASWTGMAIENGEERQQNHLGFNFLSFNNLYYRDMVTVTIKGLELELVKILTVFTSIDASSNNFDGTIPETIGDLSSLYVLNLSHNALSGSIPKSIGKLKQLGSLDLSSNQLTGEIPHELTDLTFLSVLNLAYNKLFGRIPIGNQFQTFPSASYEGNAGLCGPPLNDSCNSNESAANSATFSKLELNWQFIIAGLGYGIGAALLLGPILFCKKWRQRCEKQVDRYLKMVFPGYGFSYVRYNGKADNMEKEMEDYTTDDDEDDEDYDDEDILEKLSRGSYCLFCSKLDSQIKKALHNPKCTCHYSPPTFSFFSTSTSGTDSLQVVYQ